MVTMSIPYPKRRDWLCLSESIASAPYHIFLFMPEVVG